jgi:predicted metal-dependent phosphoesterase TrpH
MIFDLHSHTTLSDGVLKPHELISRAVEKGVDALAITDHDTIDAYREIPLIHDQIKLVPGIELSTQWESSGIHVLGLNIDLQSDAIITAARMQSDARLQRARRIGERLEKKGIKGAFEGANELSASSYIGRPHFAQHLINIGKSDSMSAAFKKYMGDGKAGDVKQHWAELPQIIQWIRDANGIAVLAHPLKYKLTRTRLKRLLDSFIEAGGQGMEVVSGKQLPDQTKDMAELCEQKNLLASCGSDFHMPGKYWAELGAIAPLPRNVIPVWDRF